MPLHYTNLGRHCEPKDKLCFIKMLIVKNLVLVDFSVDINIEIDVLIRAEYYCRLTRGKVNIVDIDEPIVIETLLGMMNTLKKNITFVMNKKLRYFYMTDVLH